MHLIPVCDLSNYNNHIYLIVFSSSLLFIYLFYKLFQLYTMSLSSDIYMMGCGGGEGPVSAGGHVASGSCR